MGQEHLLAPGGRTGSMRSDESEERFIRDAFDLMGQMEQLQTERAVSDKLSGLLSTFGLDRFVVARLPQPRENIGPARLLQRWPQAWERHYEQSDYYQFDPMSRQCFRAAGPFLLSDLRVDPRSDPMGF